MPILEIDACRVVRYSKQIEVTDAQAAEFSRAFESGDKQEIEDAISEWIDPRQDVVEAEEYEVLNALLDSKQQAF